ncbi:MAG: hypothetical protein IBX64_00150 [Actinobacteria bacterium]|nr:hypothetical protein [Actinomycetota bacterium]
MQATLPYFDEPTRKCTGFLILVESFRDAVPVVKIIVISADIKMVKYLGTKIEFDEDYCALY